MDRYIVPTPEEIKQAFVDSNLPVGHWGTWLAAVKFITEFLARS